MNQSNFKLKLTVFLTLLVYLNAESGKKYKDGDIVCLSFDFLKFLFIHIMVLKIFLDNIMNKKIKIILNLKIFKKITALS
jgi:hypothetical protein